MAKPKKTSDVIQEAVTFVGSTKEHALKALFDGEPESIPTITSIGYMGLPGTNKFVSYIIKSKGKEILSIEVSEPDLRPVAEDDSKINFVNCFMAGMDG
jgi:hypothetical protein